MKVLICTVALNGTNYNGAGWIASFIDDLKKRDDISLGVCFAGSGENSIVDGISFFPIDVFKSKYNRLRRRLSHKAEEALIIPRALHAIEQFQPDIIHIFGSENPFGLLSGMTEIPCVIHLQGILPAYYNAKFPPGTSKKDIFRKILWRHPVDAFNYLWRDAMYRYSAKREIKIIRTAKYFAGRTRWDEGIVKLINPDAKYFFASEVLRHEFYDSVGKWHSHRTRKFLKLVSVISPATFKGGDLIVKTAALLKDYSNISFEWFVFGVDSLGCDDKFLSGSRSIDELNIIPSGKVAANDLREQLLDSDIFIHPSYIDNSPNAVCEAQILGVPVVATDVGGVASLVSHGKNGILVPANDPFMLASRIEELSADSEKAETFGKKAAADAAVRHDPNSIITQTLEIYKSIISEAGKKCE